ncbi:MAG: hypothetical protein STSR0006_13170 [Lentimicrobium sp.]
MKTARKLMAMSFALMALFSITYLTSCNDDEDENLVIAGFTYKVDSSNFLKVIFTNTSQNFTTCDWNFGDGQTSTEVNPVHIYAAEGEYTVTLTAKDAGGNQDVYSTKIALSDPNVLLTTLTGMESKTWKLLRDISTGRYPLEVGPEDHSQIWWAMGRDNNELANRPCQLNDEWTFYRDGRMEFRTQGDYWAEGGMFVPENQCNTTDQMVGPNGEDLSAWGDGNHTFELTVGNPSKIKAVGKGAYIGFYKLGNGTEVKTPQDYVEYDIIKLTDGTVDTLIVEGIYRWDPASQGGYWRFVLVHYDNPGDEPPIPGPKPEASFTMQIDGRTVTFTNTTENGETYLWNFGDGNTSTEKEPVHTYAGDGIYIITLTASNPNGESTVTKQAFVSATELTAELLMGGPWRPRAEDLSIFVGPGLGDYSWWSVPKNYLDGSTTGTDDWSCITDDEFTFAEGGVYIYNTNGSARNDGYMGSPNGCWTDEQIAASGNGAAFGSGTHSWELIPASAGSRPLIILTNGPTGAAFLGFYKGYYGGENSDGANPPNGGNLTNRYEVMGYANTGTKEYLFVSVDISADHSGSSAWSVILER